MLKRLYKFQNQESFNTEEDRLNELPHFTSLKVEEEEVDYKNYKINPEDYIKPTSASVAADICIVDNGGNKYIVDGNSYSIDLFPAEQYTPIGVVVVPASHTDDSTARIISLASMDYNNPDNGKTSGNVSIAWGGYDSDISTLKNLDYSPRINTSLSNSFPATQAIQDWTGNTYYLSSDYYFDTSYEGPTNPYDTATCYGSSSNWCCPSPYLNDGSKNPLYSQVYDNGSGIGNRAEQMDGRVNTAAILAIDNAVSTAWQTADTITNNRSSSTNTQPHTAAQCCWRYHTTGTTQGDWYLPAGGELGYLASRWKAINSSIEKVVGAGFAALQLRVNYEWWSSSELSSHNAVYLYFHSGFTILGHGYNKSSAFYVRAFLAVS